MRRITLARRLALRQMRRPPEMLRIDKGRREKLQSKSVPMRPGKTGFDPRDDQDKVVRLIASRGKLTSAPKQAFYSRFGNEEMHWNLAFVGLLAWAFIEYSRLPEMYPVFQVLQLGKLTTLLAALGFLFNPRLRARGAPMQRGLT